MAIDPTHAPIGGRWPNPDNAVEAATATASALHHLIDDGPDIDDFRVVAR
jgi:hypothetical protein